MTLLITRISLLHKVKASQSEKLKDLERRLKALDEKREKIEESTQFRLNEQNVKRHLILPRAQQLSQEKIHSKLVTLYSKLREAAQPLSKQERECLEKIRLFSTKASESQQEIEKVSFPTLRRLTNVWSLFS